MIKRSLLWMLAAYCIGIVFRDRLKWMLWAVLFSYVFLIYMYRSKGRIWQLVKQNVFLQSCRKSLCLFPLIMLLGAVLAGLQAADYPIDSVLTEKVAAVAEGRICSITESKSGYRLELERIRVELQEVTETSKTIENQNHSSERIYEKGKLMVYCNSADALKIGNYIRIEGNAIPFAEPENPGQFDEKAYYRADRMCCKFNADEIEVLDDDVDVLREWCRNVRLRLDSIYEEILPQKHAGIVSAILLGDKAELDADTKELYQKNGIAHILAISGLHVSLLGMGLFAVIRRVGSPLLPAAAATAMLLLFYGCLTEFSVSTQRAVGMLIIAMAARVLGRSYDSRSACALCGLFILIANPMQLYQTGFQLSFAAAFGISYFGQELERMKLNKAKSFLGRLAVSFMSGMTTQLVTVPIVLNCFYELPVYSLLLNIPVVGLLSLLVLLSIVAGLSGMLSDSLGKFFAGGVYIILEFYELLCKAVERLPFPMWLYGKPQVWRITGYYIVLVLFFAVAVQLGKHYRHHPRQHSYRRKAFYVLCLLPLVFIKRPGSVTAGDCVVDFLSVGQGDCSVVRTENNTYVIDCGSSSVKGVGGYRLEPWLKYYGISKLEAVFLTHPDSDHTNGIMELLEKTNAPNDSYRGEIQIKTLLLPAAFKSAGIQDTGFEEIVKLAAKKRIPILWVDAGDKVSETGLNFTCLHPVTDYPVYDTNDASMVLRLEWKDTEVLFTGDIGYEGEKRILETECADRQNAKTVVLKVAHHGSKNSTSSEFLERAEPDIAVISCGKDNRFGHPHEDTLRRLQQVKSKVFITAECGAIRISLNEVMHNIQNN